MIRRRTAFLALAFATIAVGLVIHFRGTVLGPVTRDVFGDALWAMMIAWWMGALLPRTRLIVRSTAAYAVCTAVELSQLYHTPGLDSVRATTIGHLILGSGFDPRDLVAYAVGVVLAGLFESAIARRTYRPAAV